MQQQNGFIKQKFATLFNRACAMLNGWKFNACPQNDLQADAVNTNMLLKINLQTPNSNLSILTNTYEEKKRKKKHPVFDTKS